MDYESQSLKHVLFALSIVVFSLLILGGLGIMIPVVFSLLFQNQILEAVKYFFFGLVFEVVVIVLYAFILHSISLIGKPKVSKVK